MAKSSIIFSSLGVNYSTEFVRKATSLLFKKNSHLSKSNVETFFKKTFGKKPFFFYKGRDAIEFVLKSYDIGTGDLVFTQAFTCYAIEEAIKRVGADTVYVDVGKKSVNLTTITLDVALKKHSKPKAVLVQHSLSIPADVVAIRNWCDEHGVLFIEDLAQSFGGIDTKGNLLGSKADAVVISFGRDKVIDAITGGVAILLAKSKKKVEYSNEDIPRQIVLRKLLYPKVTQMIRLLHGSLLGYFLFRLAKSVSILSTPLKSEFNFVRKLPDVFYTLIQQQIDELDTQTSHRKKIADVYMNQLSNAEGITFPFSKKQILGSVFLKFPVFVDNPGEIAQELKKKNIYITDRWYRQPVDCSTLDCHSVYQRGSAPNAEKAAATVLNLPTHRYVTEADAQRVCYEIIKALKK